MMSLKHKLLKQYFREEYIPEVARLTPLRRFLYTIGFDYKDLERSEIDKWARTKRYKTFLKMRKIKRMADQANVKEEVLYENLELFLEEMEVSDDDEIIEEETIRFAELLEYTGRARIIPGHRRGRYHSAIERQRLLKQKIMNTVNTGGTVSTGESDIQFKTGKKGQLASGQRKVILRNRVPNRMLRYKRQTLRVY